MAKVKGRDASVKRSRPSKPRSKGGSKVLRKPFQTGPAQKLQPAVVIPGELFLAKDDIVAFKGRRTVELTIANTGDRPIQVGSHCHIFEANRALRFDREKAFGFRLEIPAGTAVRFEPGEEKRVTLVAFGGNRVAHGINGLTGGSLDDPHLKAQALRRAAEQGFTA